MGKLADGRQGASVPGYSPPAQLALQRLGRLARHQHQGEATLPAACCSCCQA